MDESTIALLLQLKKKRFICLLCGQRKKFKEMFSTSIQQGIRTPIVLINGNPEKAHPGVCHPCQKIWVEAQNVPWGGLITFHDMTAYVGAKISGETD